MAGPGPGRPSLTHERRAMRAGAGAVAGIDEVGRGALAGPVTVGIVLVTGTTPTAPTGLRDSKELTAPQREALAPRIRRWAAACAVAHAWPQEIDDLGLTAALRLAAGRARAALGAEPAHYLLDGSHNYLGVPAVTTRVKADRDCSSVAAASVLAKVARDQLMRELADGDDPYDWRNNKGYSAPGHLTGLLRHGPTVLHRLSWRLPGVTSEALDALDPRRLRTWRHFAQGEQLVLLPGDDASCPV